MSRAIKFRAWNKKGKCWITFGGVNYRYENGTLDIVDNDNLIYEQYTGLKDENGKEIYEGDIVKARWRRAKHAKLDTKGEIKFNDGWFYIDDDPDGQDRLCVPIHNCYNVEVIGNIHENPELLGGEE